VNYGLDRMIAVPLRARGTLLGVLMCFRSRPEHFAEGHLRVAEELAARAALSLDNARRYTPAGDIPPPSTVVTVLTVVTQMPSVGGVTTATSKAAPIPVPVPALQHVFDVAAGLGPLEDHGETRAGHRRVVPIIGGRITGAAGQDLAIDAEILPGGADWQIVRADGVVEIDARYSARTTQGELIHLRTSGVRSGPPEVLEALLRGEPADPSAYYFRVGVRIETSAPRLAALEHNVYVAAALREANRVLYSAYRVT